MRGYFSVLGPVLFCTNSKWKLISHTPADHSARCKSLTFVLICHWCVCLAGLLWNVKYAIITQRTNVCLFSGVGVDTVWLDSLLFTLLSTPEALFGLHWHAVSVPVALRSSTSHFTLQCVASSYLSSRKALFGFTSTPALLFNTSLN